MNPILVCLLVWSMYPQPGYRLHEQIAEGQVIRVTTRHELAGQVSLPATNEKNSGKGKVPLSGSAKTDYLERTLHIQDQAVTKTLRKYRQLEVERTIGNEKQLEKGRPGEWQFAVLNRKAGEEVTFSPDGPLFLSEVEAIRGDLFSHRLTGLLPLTDVSAGQTWQADPSAIRELTDLLSINNGGVQCKFTGVTELNGRKLAEVSFIGKFQGQNKDGLNQQEIKGSFKFDLDQKLMIYLSLEGKSALLDQNQQEQGSWSGTFVMTRSRVDSKEFQEPRSSLIPSLENTLLIFSDETTGLKLLYPRRWQIKAEEKSQWVLNGPGGCSGRLVLDTSNRLPSVTALREQVPGILQKQGASIKGSQPLPSLSNPLREAWSRCTFSGTQGNMESVWDYGVLEVPSLKQGLILTIRYPANSANDLRTDIETMLQRTELKPIR